MRLSVSGSRFRLLEGTARGAAEAAIPKTARDRLALLSSRASTACIIGVFAAPLLVSTQSNVDPVVWVLVFFAFGLSALALLSLAEWLAGPRRALVAEAAAALLRASLDQFVQGQLDYLRFYTTPEWQAIRRAVIRRDGRVCRGCARHISLTRDLTVDHIRPRSKFPELALDQENLQVLCRKCNSAKGAREWPSRPAAVVSRHITP